jgi:hypothetical protein
MDGRISLDSILKERKTNSGLNLNANLHTHMFLQMLKKKTPLTMSIPKSLKTKFETLSCFFVRCVASKKWRNHTRWCSLLTFLAKQCNYTTPSLLDCDLEMSLDLSNSCIDMQLKSWSTQLLFVISKNISQIYLLYAINFFSLLSSFQSK